MSLINISNCPITGLNRKLDYQFLWFKNNQKIIIRCWVYHYKDGNFIENAAIKTFIRELVASDSLVNSTNGVLLTEQEISDYNEAVAAEQEYAALLSVYNTMKPIYDNRMVSYSAAVETYNTDYIKYTGDMITYQTQVVQIEQNYATAMTQYNINFASYATAYTQYQIELSVYQTANTEYQTAYSQYETDYAAWLEDQVNLTEPTEPVAPILPIEPPAPIQPIRESYPQIPTAPFLPIEPIAPIEPIQPEPAGPPPITEYDFYANVLGVTPIILPQLLQQIILLRDQGGKFNI